MRCPSCDSVLTRERWQGSVADCLCHACGTTWRVDDKGNVADVIEGRPDGGALHD